MMYCRSCGSQLRAGAKVCPHCGTPVLAYSSNSRTSDDEPTVVSYPYPPQVGASPSYDPASATAPSSPPRGRPSTADGTNSHAPSGQPTSSLSPSSQDSYGPPLPPLIPAGLQGQTQPPRFPAGILVLLIVLAMLLVGGSGLLYYITVYQPSRQHAQATATTLAQAKATATAAVENPYTHSGSLVLSDPLIDNSQGHNWAQDPINCGFMAGAYHVKAPNPDYADDCLANATDYSNFIFEVQMRIIKGDGGGILFRDQDTPQLYRLYTFNIYQTGSYILYVQNNTGSGRTTLAFDSNAAIHQGLNQTNRIAVVARGNTITLYVNYQQITSVTDNNFSHGKIGFEAHPNNLPTEVVFSNAKVWTL